MNDFGDDLTDQANSPQLDRRAALRGLLAALAGTLVGIGRGDQPALAASRPKAGRGRRRGERARTRTRRRTERRQPESAIGRLRVRLTLHNDMGKPIRVRAFAATGRGQPAWHEQTEDWHKGGEIIAAGGSRAWTSADNVGWSTAEFLWIDWNWAVAAENPWGGTPRAGFGAGGSMTEGGWDRRFTKAEALAVGDEISGVADHRFISIRRNEDSDYKEFVAHIKQA